MIALSTSIHLVVMFVAVSCRLFGVCVMHILTHAFVKASCFIASRVKIGITGTQDIRWWSMENRIGVILLSFLLLCRVGRSMVYNSKEMILLNMTMMLVIAIGWKYTKVFLNGISRINTSMLTMSYSSIILVFLRRSGFGRVDFVSVLILVRGVICLVNSWSGYVINK